MGYIKNADLTAEIVKCQETNTISNKLAVMLVNMIDNYSRRGNWRHYSYLDDMRSDALLQLLRTTSDGRPNVLKFSLEYSQRSGKVPNGFAYCTTIISNSFKRFVKVEHALAQFRDVLIIEAGHTPSYRRQVEDEWGRSSDPIDD